MNFPEFFSSSSLGRYFQGSSALVKILTWFYERKKDKKPDTLAFIEKGHPPSADLRYGEVDSISPSTLIFAAIKG